MTDLSSQYRSKESTRLKKFLLNGSLMTLCAIALRVISMAFSVYVANVAGAEAVGLHSLLGGIYGFCVTLSLSGINLALTRLLSEAMAKEDTKRCSRLIRASLLLALCFGLFSSLLLTMIAKPLSVLWLDETRIIKPLRILSLCLPPVAISSVLNGYFAAVRRAYKNSISQLTEMGLKIAFTLIAFSKLRADIPESACLALVLGSAFAEFAVFFINLLIFSFDLRRHPIERYTPTCRREASDILSVSLPVAFTSYVRSALVSVEHSLIPKGLIKYGSSGSEALASYGTLSGMALPVINFPYAVIGSFTSLLIPEVAESRAMGKKRHIRYIVSRTYQCCLVFALCVCGAFFAFSEPLGELLYHSSEASTYIRMLSFIVPVMYIDTSTDAILKGLGEQLYCMTVNIADALLSVSLVALLVPRYGVMGYIATIYIAEIINAALSIGRLIKVTAFRFDLKKLLLGPLFCAVGAISIYSLASYLLPTALSVPRLICGILIFTAIYLSLAVITGTFSKDDLRWLLSVK